MVVRLELPDAGTRPPPQAAEAPRGPGLDPARLARAVEDLIRAIDPTLAGATVQIEVTRSAGDERDQIDGRAGAAYPSGRRSDFRSDLRSGFEQAPDQRPDQRSAPARDLSAEQSDLGLDLAGRTLSVDGRVVVLTRREFDLLAYLQDRRGVALSRRELMNSVWQTGYLVGDRTIDVHVRRLRVKLGRQADRLSTLRGYGYRLD